MTGRTHIIMATSGALVLAQATGQDAAGHACLIIGSAATAKLPDVDHKLGIPHRTITHWLFTGLVLCAAVTLAVWHWTTYPDELILLSGAGLLFGYWMHLFGDALTKGGVPLLGPVYREDIFLLPSGGRIKVREWKHKRPKARDWIHDPLKSAHRRFSESAFLVLWFTLIAAFFYFNHTP